MHKAQRSHETYVGELYERFHKDYEFMVRNVEYKDPHNGVCGEIDLLGKKGRRLALFEVKCNDHHEEAIEQLRRARGVLSAPGLEFDLFYYSGSRKLLRKV